LCTNPFSLSGAVCNVLGDKDSLLYSINHQNTILTDHKIELMEKGLINEQVSIEKLNSTEPIKQQWDSLVVDFFQSSVFLNHIEKSNFCFQRYYVLYKSNVLIAGAIVYTLPVNILTFSNKSFTVKMNVIGVPASVDSSGLIGNKNYSEYLVEYILKEEKGLVLCLNYESAINIKSLIQLEALPTIIFKNYFDNYQDYLTSMRHHYRRRTLGAIKKFKGVRTERCTCNFFTQEHYQLYLNIMTKTKTKLEILTMSFFNVLPENFSLTSYYTDDNELLTWHITCEAQDTFSFLFGGINYKLRDKFESYYNNLLGIIQEGIEKGYKTINLGQTAEIPKMRLGGQPAQKKMFIYHKNWMIRNTIWLFKNKLGYKNDIKILKVFKHEYSIL
jgi:hypothetical protein